MPWHVGKNSSCPASKPFAVIKDSDGSVQGCHSSKAKANRQLAALYANETSISRGLERLRQLASRSRPLANLLDEAVLKLGETGVFDRRNLNG